MKPSSFVMPSSGVTAVFLLIGAFASCSSSGSSSNEPGDGGEPDGGSHAEAGRLLDAGGPSETGALPMDGAPVESSLDGGSCVVPKVGQSPECSLPPVIDATPPTVSTTCISGEPPQAQGGDIPDGLYFLQSSLNYTSCVASPDRIQVSIYICGSIWLVEDDYVNDAGDSTELLAFDYAVTQDGASLVQTQQCSSTSSNSGSPIDLTFTSAAGQLTLIETADGGAREARYAKQSAP